MAYQKNNIKFRAVSSAALGSFKALQASSFIQLDRSELRFDDSAKEAVLLTFDRVSQWLSRIERICLSNIDHSRSTPIAAMKDIIVSSFVEETGVMISVIETHPDIFDTSCRKFVKLILDYSIRIIQADLSSASVKTIEELFVYSVSLLSDFVKHMLLCVHEYNSNVIHEQTEKAFITVSDFSLKHTSGINKPYSPWIERCSFYQTIVNVPSLVIKNYSRADKDQIEQIINQISQLGIKAQIETY